MENSNQKESFGKFASLRIVGGIIVVIIIVTVLSYGLGFFGKEPSVEKKPQATVAKEPVQVTKKEPTHSQPSQPSEPPKQPTPIPTKHEPSSQVLIPGSKQETSILPIGKAPKGVAFINATIKSLEYELNERFWGWRLNDLIIVTDNVNNIQRAVLEVTRRTVIILTDKISRTGSTAAIDQNLEKAMNSLMVKPEQYWFPSAESMYKDAIEDLKRFRAKLENRTATIYTRADNLIPLLMAYEDLLGSCDENLAKSRENDGRPVSFFKSDDYLYYAKGVAMSMGLMLEAIQEDFQDILNSVLSMEILNDAITSCHEAGHISPWIVLNSDLSSIFANHRANMAAHISHARFYIGLLIKAITT